MEKRKCYSRIVLVPTSAARIASVKNNRKKILLLERSSRGLSCESDGTLRTFYRERAEVNNFLQKVHSKNTGMLKAKFARNGQVTGDDRVDEKTGVVTRSEVRDAMKVQRLRRASLDICQTDETRRRIQEFLTRDIPGTRSEPLGQLNGKNVGSDHEFEAVRNLKGTTKGTFQL